MGAPAVGFAYRYPLPIELLGSQHANQLAEGLLFVAHKLTGLETLPRLRTELMAFQPQDSVPQHTPRRA
jgi:hypothetical protein